MSRRRYVLAAGAAVAVGLVAVGLVAACSSSGGAPRDDRPKVMSRMHAFEKALQATGNITSVPAIRTTPCESHSSILQWSANVVQGSYATDQQRQYETEQNVLGAGITALRLDNVRILQTGVDSEPVDLYTTSDHKTQLIVSVPRGLYVRVDGYVSC